MEGFFVLRVFGAFMWKGLYTEGLNSQFYGTSFNAFWKCLRLGNSAWDFWGG